MQGKLKVPRGTKLTAYTEETQLSEGKELATTLDRGSLLLTTTKSVSGAILVVSTSVTVATRGGRSGATWPIAYRSSVPLLSSCVQGANDVTSPQRSESYAHRENCPV